MNSEGRRHSAPRPGQHDDAFSVGLVKAVTARVVYLNEALEAGDLGLAHDIVRDLEDELFARARRHRARCRVCGLDCGWPGLVEKHVGVVHPEEVPRYAA